MIQFRDVTLQTNSGPFRLKHGVGHGVLRSEILRQPGAFFIGHVWQSDKIWQTLL